MLLPLIRVHCHLKATTSVIGAILHISNDCSGTYIDVLRSNADANSAASRYIATSPAFDHTYFVKKLN